MLHSCLARFQRRARWVTLLFLLPVVGCGGSVDDARPAQVGSPDKPKVSDLHLDETAMTAGVNGSTLALRIRVSNPTSRQTQGSLAVRLISVDGTKIVASTAATYRLDAGGKAELTAQLPLPKDVTTQPDWVRYSILVEGAAAQGSLRVTRSLLTLVAQSEVRLEGPSSVTRGRKVSYRLRTQDPVSHQPQAGVPVELIIRQGDKVVAQPKGATGDRGDVVFELALDVEGKVDLEARALGDGPPAVVADSATVARLGAKVLLTTDKPLYQPGQTIHLRALALDHSSGKPIVGQPARFEIEDGKGNKILKRDLTSDQYGLAATTFRLGPVLNLGTFKVRVIVGPDTSEKTVEVSRYALPKFKIAVTTDRAWYGPGDTINGVVDAHYFFGKPVAGGEVLIEGSTLDIGSSLFGRVMGRIDADGRFVFALTLPNALVGLPLNQGSALGNLQVTVTDTAGQQVAQQRPVTVAGQPLRLALVPESTVLVPGLDNNLDLFVTDPLGAPIVGAAVQVAAPGVADQKGTTDAFGHAALIWTPAASGPATLTVTATTKAGQTVREPFDLGTQDGSAHVIVRTDRAVYGLGDNVDVEVRTSVERKVVYVDWINDGQTVDMRTLDVTDGVAHFQKAIDPGLLGASRIEAYVVNQDGNLVRAGRSIFARNAGGLSVDLATDQPQYTPGAPAQLTFSVKDETGAPAVAALGVQIVDEAVFALVDAQPGLLKTYFGLEQAFAVPHYQIRAPAGNLTQVLFEDTAVADPVAAGAAQIRAAATLAAIGSSFMGIQKGSWAAVGPAVQQKLAPSYDAEKQRLLKVVNLAVAAALRKLTAEGCAATEYFCAAKSQPLVDLLRHEVGDAQTFFDFWGNKYDPTPANYDEVLHLRSAGPDEVAGTDDDGALAFRFSELTVPALGGIGNAADNAGAVGLPGGVAPPGALTPVAPGAGGSSGTAGPVSDPGTTSAAQPRVRQDFPETLYVNPALITGPDGKAQVKLDMADSITSWRVSSLAHSAAGKLGGGTGAVRVFQEFFVDVDFPATLTRGDEIDFPVAVYSYLPTPQTVHVELAPASWYVARGPTSFDLLLGPSQVTGVRFPVRVQTVGRQTLTVKALGGQRSDAVARSVLVLADGQAVPVAASGSLANGTVSRTVTFPAEAIAGSASLHLDVFPAFLAQVVQGMDSLLRVPNGCFEQTTSTAWPNVLVTDYLKQTNQLKPDIALKAESLMSAGYQRLLTFEHKGGGFSWFGEQDDHPFLSVTAFGLMEFSDMAKVQPVDEAMIARTQGWLAAQQTADGSWAGDQSEFFTFNTSLLRNTAFVIWSLGSSGYQGPAIARGLDFLHKQVGTGKNDPYTLAIVANALATVAPADPALTNVMAQIAAARHDQTDKDGDKTSWDAGDTQTNFYGGGDDAKIATTALVVQALLLTGGDKVSVERGLAYLAGARDSQGNFGSTQATIWTLRALLLASRKGTEGAVGSFSVDADGQHVSDLMLTAAQSDVMTTIDLSPFTAAGPHTVTLNFTGTGKVSYNLVAQHNLPWTGPALGATGPLGVTVSYDKTHLAVDDAATANVVVRNNTHNEQNMIMATVGLPPGFQVLTEDLDAYVAKKFLSSYELTGKQLLLYVTALKADGAIEIAYRLRAVMPVKASDGGAQAYLYYQPAQRSAAPATILEAVAAAP